MADDASAAVLASALKFARPASSQTSYLRHERPRSLDVAVQNFRSSVSRRSLKGPGDRELSSPFAECAEKP